MWNQNVGSGRRRRWKEGIRVMEEDDKQALHAAAILLAAAVRQAHEPADQKQVDIEGQLERENKIGRGPIWVPDLEHVKSAVLVSDESVVCTVYIGMHQHLYLVWQEPGDWTEEATGGRCWPRQELSTQPNPLGFSETAEG
jgi:hypothetical protein